MSTDAKESAKLKPLQAVSQDTPSLLKLSKTKLINENNWSDKYPKVLNNYNIQKDNNLQWPIK